MNRSDFAVVLREANIVGIRDFRSRHPEESIYAFALILGQRGNYLGFAIATEEGLQRVAANYFESGYRYKGASWQVIDHHKELAVYLRWSHPDDGWYYEDFSEQFDIAGSFKQLVTQAAFGDDADQLEEFCTDVLTSLQTDPEWEKLQQSVPIVVGVYEGDNPQDFLRTATRCNSYAVVRRLWGENWRAQESSSRITRPDRHTKN